jgi:hypothetical protein
MIVNINELQCMLGRASTLLWGPVYRVGCSGSGFIECIGSGKFHPGSEEYLLSCGLWNILVQTWRVTKICQGTCNFKTFNQCFGNSLSYVCKIIAQIIHATFFVNSNDVQTSVAETLPRVDTACNRKWHIQYGTWQHVANMQYNAAVDLFK